MRLQQQIEIKVACRCGWEGLAPSELIPNMGTADLLCSHCYAKFEAWPTRQIPDSFTVNESAHGDKYADKNPAK